MPVIPFRANLFQDCKELYQFLFACQTTSLEKEHTQIVSISLEVPPVDLLAALQSIQQSDQLHFYLERRRQGEAIAGIDPVIQLKVEGSQRFTLAKNFIHSTLVDTITAGALHLPFAGPHFFCSFTFFDHNLAADAPFPAAMIFLPRWQIACRKQQGVVVANLLVDSESDLENLSEEIWQKLQKIRALRHSDLQSPENHASGFSTQGISGISNFKAAVSIALASIQAKHFNKIVLAHVMDVISPQAVDLFHSLDNLRDRYPDCYVFSTSNGQGQNFIGASPERLIRIHDCQLVSDALAGSAARGQSLVEDAYLANRLLRSEKDIREHRIVIDFITECLAHLQMTPQISPPPHLLQLPNIQHLRTLIKAQVPPHLHLLDILAELHPTPAVAGAPREIACQHIRRYETFERNLYAAPLGWIDYQGNGEFAVGIRSALIDDCHTRLYAGAGIVAGSDPEKELTEIKLKLQALLESLA